VSVGRLLERKLAVDYRLELPLAGEGDQPFHRLATRLRVAGSLDAGTFFLQRPEVEGHRRVADCSWCHERSLPCQGLDAVRERVGADRVEDDIGLELADLGIAICERLGAERTDPVELLGTRRCVHLRPERATDVD
jgi:hypothetical protein